MNNHRLLVERLKDRRSGRVIFLSHCLLNENTRYPGGACAAGCVREVVDECFREDLGIVQMPCPEESAWGGVLKRRMLMEFGLDGSPLHRVHRLLMPLYLRYTRHVYRRIARRIARQIEDYVDSGYDIAGVVGVDGSPSCGVHATLDIQQALDLIGDSDRLSITAENMNMIVRRCVIEGKGLFIEQLQKQLVKRQIDIPCTGYDLVAELEGKPPHLELPILPPAYHIDSPIRMRAHLLRLIATVLAVAAMVGAILFLVIALFQYMILD
jgi:predicted secreted protein